MGKIWICPICNAQAKEVIDANDQSYDKYDCPFCGKFGFSGDAKRSLSSRTEDSFGKTMKEGFLLSDKERGLLGGELRWAKIENRKPFGEKDFIIQSIDLPELIAKCPQNLTPADKLDLLLRYYAEKSEYVGDLVKCYEHDSFAIYSTIVDELEFLRKTLSKMDLLEYGHLSGSTRVTVEGWNAYYDLVRNRANSNRAFVAMSFDEKLKIHYLDGIKKALSDPEVGFEPIRVDELVQDFDNKLCDRIMAEIRQSQIVIADFTGQRAGVYFEAGFAKGLGIPVIWTCKEEKVNDLHFDTRQYGHILWKDSEDLRKQLKDRILARIDIFRGKDK